MRLAKVIVAALVACSALAQVPAVKETISVHVVEVPITVVDRDGNPVRGLAAANFQLFDDGKKQAMTSFDAIDFASPEVLKSVSPLNPAARRTFLLLFDLSYSSPLGRQKAQDAALDFIARGLSRRDMAAIGTIDVDRGFRIVTSFTTDRTLLSAAVAHPQTLVSADPLQIAGSAALASEIGLDSGPVESAKAGSRGVNGVSSDEMETIRKEMAVQEMRMTDSHNRARAENQIQMLSQIAKTLRILPGRKQLILFSEGFDPKLIQGRQWHDAEINDQNELVLAGKLWNIDNDQRYGSTTSLTMLDRMSQFFRGSDVVLHAIDIQGVRVQNDVTSGATSNSNEGLHLLAAPTGGEVFKNSNSVMNDLSRMLRQQEVVYVLGFRTETRDDGKFHNLAVKLVNVPSGLKAFHRLGYFDSGAENGLERRLSNAEVVLNDLPADDVHLAALAAALPGTAGQAQVPVVLEINGADLAKYATKGKPLAAEIFIYAFDDEGIVRDRIYQRLTIDIDKVNGKLDGGGIKYVANLRLPDSRHYAIKSLVRLPEGDKKGFTRTDIVVPHADDVAVLPPLFIDDPARWLIVRGISHDKENATYPFHINGEPFIPSASVNMKSGESRKFAVFVYNATADEMLYETKLSNAAGVTRSNAATLLSELQGDDVTKLVFQYAPAPADSATSTLDVTVKRKGSSDTRTSHIPINVRQ
jgi:VWFA-related protein